MAGMLATNSCTNQTIFFLMRGDPGDIQKFIKTDIKKIFQIIICTINKDAITAIKCT